jgi:hypothetical protein
MNWFIIALFLFILIIYVGIKLSENNTGAVIKDVFGGGKRNHSIKSSLKKNTNQSSLKLKNLDANPRSASEANAVSILEKLLKMPMPTAYPNWLLWKGRNLELDGYNEKGKIALEFSGPLHSKWDPQKESYEKYFERLVKDVVKKKLCKKHKVTLITIDMSLGSKHWLVYIKSRLYDAKWKYPDQTEAFIKEEPFDYIKVQEPEIYRNLILEKELGLDKEMERAFTFTF